MSRGFTLLEMVVSMTVISLILMSLYLGFATISSSWRKHDTAAENLLRRDALLRVISEDLVRVRPYTTQGNMRTINFFVGGKNCLFYATTSGYASRHRSKGELFFACMFIDESPEGRGKGLYLVKSALPEPVFIEQAVRLATMDTQAAAEFLPDDALREQARLVMDGLGEARLSYEIADDTQAEGFESASFDAWQTPELPRAVRFLFADEPGGPERALRTALPDPLLKEGKLK